MVVAFKRELPSLQCPVPVPSAGMGADVGEASGHGPSEFSIVRDSIRRDREALFEGTRAVRARRTRTSALRFFSCSKIGQPTTDAPRPRSPLDSPSIPPVSLIAVHTEYRGGQRR